MFEFRRATCPLVHVYIKILNALEKKNPVSITQRTASFSLNLGYITKKDNIIVYLHQLAYTA